jgi:polysaccharide pyruvyl transferase WcaK-like protein
LNQFILYGHGSSKNHGAEAIVKTTIKIIRKKYPGIKIVLSSNFPEDDKLFGVDADKIIGPDPVLWEKEKSVQNRTEKYKLAEQMYAESISHITPDTVCLSIGGDNYCYSNWHRLECFHNAAIESGARSVLWSCSIEPVMIDTPMLKVLAGHHLITARESATLAALHHKGLSNVVPCVDIAFLLEPESFELPDNFQNMVALNLSPLVIRRETSPCVVVKAFRNLVQYILNKTDLGVAFVPHVVLPMDNDVDAIQSVLDGFPDNPRIYRAPDNLNAGQYKYIISRCRFGIFARTHASIAAYSSCVPAIAIGYSIKAQGLAADLGFSKYLCPVSSISPDSLVDCFRWLMENEASLCSLLTSKLPLYQKQAVPQAAMEWI